MANSFKNKKADLTTTDLTTLYTVPTAEAQVRDLDAIVEKLNTTFQEELKDEVEAFNFFLQ